MMLNEIQEPKIVEAHSNHVQSKEPIPKIVPPSSSSSEDNVDRYKIMVRKRSTREQNKFKLKSKAEYNPTIKDKVIVIDKSLQTLMQSHQQARRFLKLELRRIN